MAATARVVDLTNAGEGGSFKPRRKPEGDYRAKIVKADDHQPKDKTKPAGWVLTVQIEGDARSTYPIYLSPAENQAWKIGQVCRAAGIATKSARIKFDPNRLVGKAIGVFLEDDEFEGREKSTIGESFPVSEVGGRADEDDVDTDDEEVIDDDELEDEPEPEPVKPDRSSQAAAARKRTKANVRPAPEPEDDDEEDDEEEEAPAPPPRKRTAVARRKAAPAPVVEDDEDLDLDDLDD